MGFKELICRISGAGGAFFAEKHLIFVAMGAILSGLEGFSHIIDSGGNLKRRNLVNILFDDEYKANC